MPESSIENQASAPADSSSSRFPASASDAAAVAAVVSDLHQTVPPQPASLGNAEAAPIPRDRDGTGASGVEAPTVAEEAAPGAAERVAESPQAGADGADLRIFHAEIVSDAEMLIAYFTRHNVPVEKLDEVAQAVAHARELLARGGFRGSEVAAFFGAYGRLTTALQSPMTVASLRDSLDVRGADGAVVRHSKARQACRLWGAVGFLALWLLLIVHNYWRAGRNLVDMEIRSTDPVEIAANAGGPDTPAAAGDPKASPVALPTAGAAALKGGAASNRPFDPSAFAMSEQTAIHTRFVLLAHWCCFWRWSSDWFFNDGVPRQAWLDEFKNDYSPYILLVPNKLNMLYSDILPLLYGLLGATVYVLRTVAQEAQERKFRAESMVAAGARVCLGMLAGLAIGLFWRSSDAQVASLSPFAMAFTAGYSVEVFFALMDKVVSSFQTAKGT